LNGMADLVSPERLHGANMAAGRFAEKEKDDPGKS